MAQDPLNGNAGFPRFGGLGDANQDQRNNQPFIIDMVTKEILFFQTIPLEIEDGGETTWAVIQAPGRNIPLFQYTGAEDTLTFSLSWYANTESKEDVLKKCKWLKAISRNDGYDQKPHRIKLVFGKMFTNAEWVVFSAKYKISLFDRSKGMYPCLAIQDVILKRVITTNLSRAEILKLDT